MARYKELKYKDNIIIDDYKINEILIKEKYNWIINAEIKDARLEIYKDTLVWNAGTWYSGVWYYGVWRNGEWKFGTWEDGVWYNGFWRDGLFKNGLIVGGRFYQGQIIGFSEIRKGEFIDVDISPSVKRNDLNNQQSKTF
jgi:hypothetical protein